MEAKSGCPVHAMLDGVMGSRALPVWARVGLLGYGLVAYGAFFGTILYAIGFVGNWVVPKSIDSGGAVEPVMAMLVNAALLSVFVVQHTVMARRGFKAWLTRWMPAAMERSTFVLLASASLALIFWQWRPMPGVVWEVENVAARAVMHAVSLAGWATVLLSSFMVSHWDLFGLRQVWFAWKGRAYAPVGFRLRGLYRLVRHPLMMGFLVAFWSAPTMTLGHLFFALMVSGYIAFGVWMEERDLVREHGAAYLEYRRKVRAVIPLPRRAAGEGAVLSTEY